MGFDGPAKGGVRNGLWGVLAIFVVLAALLTVLMRTATFIELAVWFQTDRSERVVNAVLVGLRLAICYSLILQLFKWRSATAVANFSYVAQKNKP